MTAIPDSEASALYADGFKTTLWSIVLSAGNKSESVAQPALEELCRTYWFPLYAYVRRQGVSPEDAKDLTQAFFERFLQRGYFAHADPERGRFRAYLLTCMKRFLAEEWRRTNRQKRGAGVVFVQIETEDAEGRYTAAPPTELSPDRLYDRHWAEAILERTTARLMRDYEKTGRAAVCSQLQQFLWGGQREIAYGELGAKLGMSEGAVKVAVHRLRQRFRDLVREEVAGTVQTPEEVDGEIKHLLATFAD
jgi:RNA polymerase sigma-70 factor (ECF subfamily)